MQTPTSPLVVREHERVRCDLPASFSIAPEHADRVALAPAAGVTPVPASLIDLSAGGLGLSSPVYVPKLTLLRISVDPAQGEPGFTVLARVQRAAMLDKTPTYFIGTALKDATESDLAILRRLLAALARRAQQPDAGLTTTTSAPTPALAAATSTGRPARA